MKKGKRESILQSALKQFASNRYDEVLMDDIAVKAKIGKGTIYRYFSTKEELYVNAIIYSFKTYEKTIKNAFSKTENPKKQLYTIIEALVFLVSEHVHMVKLLGGVGHGKIVKYREKLRKSREGIINTIEEVIEKGIRKKLFVNYGKNNRIVCDALMGMIFACIVESPKGISKDRIIDIIYNVFTEGIRRRK